MTWINRGGETHNREASALRAGIAKPHQIVERNRFDRDA
jgi:hypothetical protein